MGRPLIFVAIAVAFTALSSSRVGLEASSLLLLLSFGRMPRLSWFSEECPKTVQVFNDPCLNQTTGRMNRYDAAHDAALTDRLLEAALEAKCPVVIERPFNDDACFERVQTLAHNSTTKLKVKMLFKRQAEGDTIKWWPNAIKDDSDPETKTMPFGDFFSKLESGPALEYTSFENSLVDSYANVWGHNLSWIDGMAASNFLGHFPRTVVSSPYHSALWDSFGYQCVGTKEWRFMPPLNAFQTVFIFGTGWTRHVDCTGRDDADALAFQEVVGPDTIMYFPPWWAHSVLSHKGLNMLFNYRKLDFRGMFRQGSLRAAFAVIEGILQKTAYKGYDPPEVMNYLKNRKENELRVPDEF